MKLLLDTHVLLWWLDDPTVLAEVAREAIAEPENQIFVSAVSCWEIAIKRGLGKLSAPADIHTAIRESSFLEMPVLVVHALQTERLPYHHRDPFDRMLIAQAQCESAVLVTRDRAFFDYGVPLIGA